MSDHHNQPMNDTPRTDSVSEIRIVKCAPLEIVTADFARQLERELNEAKKEIESLQGALRIEREFTNKRESKIQEAIRILQ